jgi:hypothetical protein
MALRAGGQDIDNWLLSPEKLIAEGFRTLAYQKLLANLKAEGPVS